MAGIVVEGPDGAGKTTLVRKLRNAFGWPVIHVVQPHLPNIKQMFQLIECSPVIFDRFQWSPIVYGEVLRNGPELDKHNLWAIEGRLAAKGFVNVLCTTNIAKMLSNNRKAEQLWEETKEEKCLADLTTAYRRELSESSLPKVEFDYQTNEFDDLLAMLKSEMSQTSHIDMLGTTKPHFWIVGDERADRGKNGINLPFVNPTALDRQLSGVLLQKAMEDCQLDWSNTAITNSANLNLKDLQSFLCHPKEVIALGNKALQRLESFNIKAAKIPHPAYWQRFHRKNPAGYSALMEAVIDG